MSYILKVMDWGQESLHITSLRKQVARRVEMQRPAHG